MIIISAACSHDKNIFVCLAEFAALNIQVVILRQNENISGLVFGMKFPI
jgi:hypothetical protein